MKVFIINLARSIDRRSDMIRQMDRCGITFEFFNGVDGQLNEHLSYSNYKDEYCLRAWRRPLTSGEVGCFASHYLLWEKCVELDEPIVILEDDVIVHPQLSSAVSFVEALSDLEYVRLSGIETPKFRELAPLGPEGRRLVRFLSGPMGTQCYVLFPSAARKLLAGAAVWKIPVDSYLDNSWLHGVPVIGLLPFPVDRRMDIGSEIWPSGGSRSLSTRHQIARPKRIAVRLTDLAMRIICNSTEWARTKLKRL